MVGVGVAWGADGVQYGPEGMMGALIKHEDISPLAEGRLPRLWAAQQQLFLLHMPDLGTPPLGRLLSPQESGASTACYRISHPCIAGK